MAESERAVVAAAAAAAGDEGVGAEVLDGDRQTELCPNCRQPYSWMCGEDAVPTSLGCGHSLCFRCAKSQWRSPGPGESPVLCAACSTPVAVSTYKPVPLTRPENGPPSSMKAGDCDPAAVDDTDSGHTEPVTITPTHLPSASEVVLAHSCERKQSSSAGCPMEKVASTLSSPLVLDKIQSQDDAWRLLQHDEGFIRDWIVANVPDHVIFKMVGVGSSDSSLDSSSLVLSNGNTVVITSPPKAEDVHMATPETAGPTSTAAGPGAQGDSVVRASFEQQFLHYLVSKATPADKPAGAIDLNREHGLPETLTTVDSAAQTGPEIILEDRAVASSSSVAAAAAGGPDSKSKTMEMVKQGLKHIHCAGEESKVSVFHMEKSSKLPNGMIEDQASPLGSDIQAHVMQSVTSQSSEAEQYPSGLDPSQSVLALQPPPIPDYKSCLPTANISYHPVSVQNPYQENCASQMFGNSTRGMTRFPPFPAQGDFQPSDSGVSAGPHHRMYSSYSFMYSHPSHPSWQGQGLPRYPRMPQRFQQGPFQRCPQYMPHHGERFGRDGGPAYPPSVHHLPSDCSWSSKACTTALNPPPPSTVSSQPQIRFVQVVRPKPDLVSVPELPRIDGDAAPSMGRVDEAMGKEPSATSSPRDREAEVALMKTRNMPHGTQVEDIYVVPQVWLNGGGGPSSATELMQHNESSAGHYPGGSPHRPFAHPAASKFTGDQDTGGPASQKSSEKSAAAGVYNSRLLNHLVTTGFAGPDVNSLKREKVPETSDPHEAPDKAVGCMSENPEETSGSKDNDYTDFKPVAVVTTISVSKSHPPSAARTETTAPERRGLPVPPLLHSSTATVVDPVDTERAASGWTPSIETPVRDQAMIMDGVHGKDSVGQVPPAPIKKMDGHLEWKHATQNVPFGPNAVQFSRQNGNESAPSLSSSSHITGPCNKTSHDALVLEMSRCAEADTQTAASANEVEIIEDKSSLPSTIMLPRQKPAQISYNRKRFRRNLCSEFHNSDISIRGSYYANQPAERRTYSRSGRPFSSKYSQYSSVYGSPPHAPYSYPYPYSHGPRPYYYSSYANTPSTALRYRHPCPYPQFFSQPSLNKPSDYQFGVPVDEVPVLARMYPLLPRSASHAFPYPHFRPEAVYPGTASQTATSSLPQPFPDVLSHLSSGRGDFSNTSSIHVQPKASLISPQDSSDVPKANAGCGSEDISSGSGIRQLRFWPDREESGDGDGFSVTASASHHRVSLQDLETVRWIQQEIRELNKELDSSVLTQLEGCLALLEKSAHQVSPAAVTTGPPSQNLRDRDHLWRCILTLGKAVVQYGWWCQPHHWDGSSQRWAEMAMLASDVFTHSMHSLIEVIIFYLDHALTTVTGDDGQVEGGFPDQQVDRVLSDDAFMSVDVPESSVTTYRQQQQQAQAPVVQSDYAAMLAKGQCPVARDAVAQLAYSSTAGDSSQTQVPDCHQQQGLPSSVGTDRQMNTVTVDPPESYVPHPSTFSHYEDEGMGLPQPGDADLSRISFAVEDQSGAGREQETIPSVVYHYQVSGVTEETHVADYGRGLQRAGNVDLNFQERSAVWTPDTAQHSHRGSGHSFDTLPPDSVSVEQPGLPTDTSPVVESVHDRDRATTIVMTSPAVNQTQMEVYYTLEGESLMDGITATTQAPCDSEERKRAESVVYAVSHLMKVDSPSEELDSTVGYILSAEVDESLRQQPETQDNICMKTELTNAAKAVSPSHDSPPHNPKESGPRPEDAEPATDVNQQNQGSNHVSEMSGKDVNMVDGEADLHSDQTDVNVFMVTVPADRANSRDVECSGQEVISDTAIMLSETVEIETDGTVEVSGVKQAESSRSPPAKRGCPDAKENINSSSHCGKRKRTRTPQSKNKHFKQDLSHEKPSGKGTLAVKSGKWNLRSSRGSGTEGLNSK